MYNSSDNKNIKAKIGKFITNTLGINHDNNNNSIEDLPHNTKKQAQGKNTRR